MCSTAHDTQPFKRKFHKMVKRTQTIRREFANCLSVFDHFVKLALTGLRDFGIKKLGAMKPKEQRFH